MAATIALKEQTKNWMNFETGYLFCHVETKTRSFDRVFLYKENHAIVAWFQRRLMPMMQKEKLLLL